MHSPTFRVIRILNTIAASDTNLSMAEIAKLTQIPAGTLFPIIKTLLGEQFISYDNRENKYSIGLRLYLDGMAFLRSSDSYLCIRKLLEKLTADTGETTHFGKLDGGNVLYLLKVDSPQPIRMFSAMGKQLTAYGTGLGKALLCEYTLEQLKQLYRTGLKPITDHTITDFDELYRQLQKVKETGFAYECEESNEGIQCIAKPIYKNGQVCAAVSVGIPTFRYSSEKESQIKTLLNDTAEKIEKIALSLDYL